MKKRNLIILALIALIVIPAIYAFSSLYVYSVSPPDNTIYLQTEQNWTFVVNASSYPAANYNISNCTLYSNSSGTWQVEFANETNATGGTELTYYFHPAETNITLSDNLYFVWAARCLDNHSNITWTLNRSMIVQTPPTINTQTPADGNKTNYTRVNITLNVTGKGDYYVCEFWNNRSGTNHSSGNFSYDYIFTVRNASLDSWYYDFDDDNSTIWNVKCHENGNSKIYRWGANNTLNVYTPTLTVTLDSPGSVYENKTGQNLSVNMTATGGILDACRYWVNGTLINTTSTMQSGLTHFMGNITAATGEYQVITVGCNDTLGNIVNATTLAIRFDNTTPRISTFNNYTIKSCNKIGLTINGTENISLSTVTYAVAGASTTTTDTNTEDGVVRLHNISFGTNEELYYQVNVSLTDQAGNVNRSIFEYNITMPVSVCSGWNVFTNYNDTINMSSIEQVVDVAEFVYWWNSTVQGWVAKTNGTATNENITIHKGEVIWIYNSINATWYRGNTVNPFLFNLTNGSNFMGSMNMNMTFGNLSFISMRNASGGNTTNSTFPINGAGLYNFSVTDFASWNNTGKEWIPYFFAYDINNDTVIGKKTNNSLDAFWIFTNYTITYNSSVGVNHIVGNWSTKQ